MMPRLLLIVAFAFSPTYAAPPRPTPKPTVPQEVETLKAEVRELRRRIEELESQVSELRAMLPPDARRAEEKARVDKGVRDNRLAAGMTLAHVRGIAGTQGELIAQTDATETYRFLVPNNRQILLGERKPESTGAHLIFVIFQNGKAIAFRRQELPNTPARPPD